MSTLFVPTICDCSIHPYNHVVKTQASWNRHIARKQEDVIEANLAGPRQVEQLPTTQSIIQPVYNLPSRQELSFQPRFIPIQTLQADVILPINTAHQSINLQARADSDDNELTNGVQDAHSAFAPHFIDIQSESVDNSGPIEERRDIRSSEMELQPGFVDIISEDEDDLDSTHQYDIMASQIDLANSVNDSDAECPTPLHKHYIGLNGDIAMNSSDTNSLNDKLPPGTKVVQQALEDQLEFTYESASDIEPTGQTLIGYVDSDKELEAFNTDLSQETTSVSSEEEPNTVLEDNPEFDYSNPHCEPLNSTETLMLSLQSTYVKYHTQRECIREIHEAHKAANIRSFDYRKVEKLMENLTKVEPRCFDCCPKSCMSYAMYPDLEACKYCNHPRYREIHVRKVTKKNRNIETNRESWATYELRDPTHSLKLMWSDKATACTMTRYPYSVLELFKETGARSDYWTSEIHSLLLLKGETPC
ncbi:hypothetical protein EDC01DRAFT_631814 [Geopyxis carbonaria]|nr:hypothetical protein EDC01DRAFT_631814 [Geopyxis carbonaria]